MPVNRRLATIGVAKQTAKGTPATTATYRFGLTDGGVMGADIKQDDVNDTWASRQAAGVDRSSVVPGADFTQLAMPATAGLWLFAAYGADAVTGTGPYTHTITLANNIPYLTLWGVYSGEVYQLQDAQVDSLEWAWDGMKAVTLKVKHMGTVLTFPSVEPTYTNDERPTNNNYFSAASGVFNLDGVAARVVSGSLKFDLNLDSVPQSNAVTPSDQVPGLMQPTVSLKIVPDDTKLWRRVLTGSDSGTAVSGFPYLGSVTLKWVKDANTDITFTASNIAFLSDLPDANPDGGAMELTLEGKCFGTHQWVLRNGVASY